MCIDSSLVTFPEPAQHLLDHLDFVLGQLELLGQVLHVCRRIVQPHVLSLCSSHSPEDLQQVAGQSAQQAKLVHYYCARFALERQVAHLV